MTRSRRAALRDLLIAADVDALLVTDLVNVRYLTGFTGSNAVLLVHAAGEERTRFGTDGRYRTQAAIQVPELERIEDRATDRAVAAAAHALGVRRLGFESDSVTVDAHAALDAAADGVSLHRVPGLVQRLRVVKDDGEVAALRTACAAADSALADLIADGGVSPGRTERGVAQDLETRMRGYGAQGPSFETIVAAGEHSAVPHHLPTDAELRAGDLVKIDFGALQDGYHSDMTRTVVLGPAAEWQRELHGLVAAAAQAGREAAVPDADVVAVDGAARAVCAAAGQAERFLHGLGHGVGLQIHEAPALSPTGTGTLSAGMAVTVEPGVYLAGEGGVRIEDLLVVRPGSADVLTRAPRELLEI